METPENSYFQGGVYSLYQQDYCDEKFYLANAKPLKRDQRLSIFKFRPEPPKHSLPPVITWKPPLPKLPPLPRFKLAPPKVPEGTKVPTTVMRTRWGVSYRNHLQCYPPPVLDPSPPVWPIPRVKPSKGDGARSMNIADYPAFHKYSPENSAHLHLDDIDEWRRKVRADRIVPTPLRRPPNIAEVMRPSPDNPFIASLFDATHRRANTTTSHAHFRKFPNPEYDIEKPFHRVSHFAKAVTRVYPFNPYNNIGKMR